MKFRHYKALAAVANDATQIDRAAGVIRGVSIISTGCAQGHGVLCDEKTLDTVLACIQTYKSGLKVKWNARTFNHGDGAILGVVPVATCKKENGQVIGDLQVAKDYPWPDEVSYLYSLAEAQADTFGLSIDFSGDAEEIDGTQYMRCTEIYAVTVVDQPAANAKGMFSALSEVTPKPKKTMLEADDITKIQSIITEAVKPLSDRVAKIEAGEKGEPEIPDPEDMSAEDKEEEEMAAGVDKEKDSALSAKRKVQAYRVRLSKLSPAQVINLAVKSAVQGFAKAGGSAVAGRGAGSGAAGGGNEDDGKSAFDKKVSALVESGQMNLAEATKFCWKKYPQEFNAHREKQQAMRANSQKAAA